MVKVLASLLHREEPENQYANTAKNTAALFDRHEHPAELLILERVEPPHAVVRVDVEVVDRGRNERHHEPDRAAEHEGCEDVPGARPGSRDGAARPGERTTTSPRP